MYYFFAVVVPPITPVTAPVFMRLPLDLGTVSFIEIHFPGGCGGLVRAALMYNSIQVIPWNADNWLYGDDRIFKLDINLPVKEPPFEFSIKAWNEDDTYAHIITVGVMLVEQTAVSMLQLLLGK
jgi:hypothetical protein